MQLYPEKYDRLEIRSPERSFIRTLERSYSDSDFGYCVLHINPRKKSVEQSNPELFNMLVSNSGIILFRHFDIGTGFKAALMLNAVVKSNALHLLSDDIRNQLAESRYLVDNEGKLTVSLSVCFVFDDLLFESFRNDLSCEIIDFCNRNCLFKEDISSMRKQGKAVLQPFFDTTKNEITEDQVNYIFQRLCPEITIPRKFILDEDSTVDFRDDSLESIDRSVISYRLDSWQIDFVNKINRGNQLILACAGSGKSVLLISKCFKLASLNPNEQFLITCYNKNLYDYYQWAIAQAGFKNKNVHCVTFLGLCKQLLEKNGISLPIMYQNKEAEYFEKLFFKANASLMNKQIADRYFGIFIDEVQIFNPEWYRFCFNLLKSKDESNHFFVIAGDKSQDVKSNIKHGKAPWQGGGSDYPEYRGKTLPIERNYRNSKPINDAIDRYVNCAKKVAQSFGVDLVADPEMFLRGTAFREGHDPVIVELSQYSNKGEANAIRNAIKKLLQQGYSEVDIAVVLYNKYQKHTYKGWETSYYNLLPYIKQAFYDENWEDPAILLSGESDGSTYGSRRGVTITSIEGALGLDFRAVVLAGLRPLGTYEKVRNKQDLLEVDGDALKERIEGFKKNINLLYTGCTRAKDELTVVLSAPRGESIYMDMLRDSIGKDE